MKLELLKFQEPQQSALSEDVVVGTLREVTAGNKATGINFYPSRKRDDGTTSVAGWILRTPQGDVRINLSKALSKAYDEGTIKSSQMGNCNVIYGTNTDGEERYYLSSQGGLLDTADVLKAFDAAETPKVSGGELFAAINALMAK